MAKAGKIKRKAAPKRKAKPKAKRAKRKVANKPKGTAAKAPRRPNGSAFTTQIRAALIAHLRNGLPRAYAAASVGVGERTVQRWVAMGRDNLAELDAVAEAAGDGDGEVDTNAALNDYGRFLLEVLEAEAGARAVEIGVIRQHGLKDWRAMAWYLERIDHRTFGQRLRTEQVHTDQNGDEQSAADVLLEKIAEIEQREAAAADGGEA